MMHSFANWSNLAGGVAVVALGLFVLSVRPRTAASKWFALFTVGFGGYFAVLHAFIIAHYAASERVFMLAPLGIAISVGLVGLAFTFPPGIGLVRRGPAAIAAGVALVLTLLRVWAAFDDPALSEFPIVSVLMAPSLAFMVGYLVLLVFAFRDASDNDARWHVAITAAALTLFVGFVAGYGGLSDGGDGPLRAEGVELALALTLVAVMLCLTGAWIYNTREPGGRAARDLAILTPATMLVGMLFAIGTPTAGGHGVMRILLAALLGYAVVRRGLLGIDVKVRWTISKSTLAAVFIAVFFIASEAAQQFFGERFESGYLGILAAGALVFVLAPLSRLADRLAEKAVPVQAPPSPTATSTVHERYRVLLRRYLGDGRLSRDEELALAHAAASMGIPAPEALRLRHEVEDEEKRFGRPTEPSAPAERS